MNPTFKKMLEDARHDPKRVKYLINRDMAGNWLLPDHRMTNAAFYRDNCLDILEELRDAIVILELLEQRLGAFTFGEIEDMIPTIRQLHADIEQAADTVLKLRGQLPDDLLIDRQDVLPVRRLTQI
jgi:hypothetical protein